MKQEVIYEVSEILDTFNLEEITKLLQRQINSNDDEETHPVDHFKALYYHYRRIMETEGNTGEIKEAARSRFMDVCNIFLSLICQKFNLTLDQEWKDDHYGDLPGLVMALYSFFVLDLSSNIFDACIAYINTNSKTIMEAFGDRKNKKDAATLVNKKKMSPELAIIISNIYDVTSWIVSILSESQYIECLPQDYIPLQLISGMLEEGVLAGDFMTEVNDIYASNIGLKSDVCFRIITQVSANI